MVDSLKVVIFSLVGSPLAGQELGLVSTIEMAVIAAALLAVIFYRLKQPALLAYILAGLVLGWAMDASIGKNVHVVEQISHLGLVFLLFIIGLEMDLSGVFKLGPRVAAAVIAQTPVTVAVIWLLQWGLDQAGLSLPGLASQPEGWLIFSVVVALSSTAVVVKLLLEKFDLDSQAGKVSLLTLIVQDIFAVVALSYLSAESGSQGSPSAWFMIGGAAVLGAAILLLAKYVLSRIMRFMSRSPDLVALVALGWCFICAAGFSQIGLSSEMGALIAGISVGRLPMATEVMAKVSSLRDFFMALFFVALGMSLPPPSLPILLLAFSLVAVVILSRMLLYTPMLFAAGQGPILSFTSPLNLAQISEFSLLLIPVGLGSGILSPEGASVISYGMMISVMISSYLIKKNYQVAISLTHLFRLARPGQSHWAQPTEEPKTTPLGREESEIIMLGYFVNSEALAQRLKQECPELIPKILVIDFNLQNHPRIMSHGLRVVYGDISNPDTLRHHGISSAKVILSTISNTFLRGTSNEVLLAQMKTLNPRAQFIATSDHKDSAARLVELGALGCVCPPDDAAPAFIRLIYQALNQNPALGGKP